MPTWGISSEGWYRPRMPEIVEEMTARWKGRFGANRNTAADTIDGKLIRIISEALALSMENAEGSYYSAFLDTNSGQALDIWAAGFGFIRNPAVASTVTLTLTGTAGTVIPAGAIVQLEATEQQFTTNAEATIGGGGTIDVEATAVETGPIAATSGSTWEIVTTVTGWDSVSNAADADVGEDEETDAAFRQRIRTGTREGGVAAAVLKLEGVTSVAVFQNDTDTPDATWSATHWVEALVVGGADQEIIDAIWSAKCPGISTQGDTSGTETVTGDTNAVRFSRGTEVEMYVTITITAGEDFSGDETEIRDGVVAWATDNHAHGDDVAPALLAAQIPDFATGRYSVVVEVGNAPSPSSTTIYDIADREVAVFDTSRANVVIA